MTLKGMQEQVLNQQMSDNFEVLKKLGQGGFGTVWLCRRTTAAARVCSSLPCFDSAALYDTSSPTRLTPLGF